jgi:hypothetical protein
MEKGDAENAAMKPHLRAPQWEQLSLFPGAGNDDKRQLLLRFALPKLSAFQRVKAVMTANLRSDNVNESLQLAAEHSRQRENC